MEVLLKLNKDAKEALEKIHLISGIKKDDVTKVLESVVILLILNYLNGEDMYIPYLGNCRLEYKGDKTVNNKLEAIVDCQFNVDDFILRNVGQIEDEKIPEIEAILKRRIHATLGEYLNKE